MPTRVDFGQATFTHTSTSSLVSCSASGFMQGETGGPRGSSPSISASSLSQQCRWARCRVPLPFNLSFCFDGFIGWSSSHDSTTKQGIIAAVRSAKLWEHLGFSIDNLHFDNDAMLSSPQSSKFDLCLALTPVSRSLKLSRRWQHRSQQGVNDLQCPPEICTTRLDSINVEFRFDRPHSSNDSVVKSDSVEFLSNAILAMVDSSLRSLFAQSCRTAKGVRRGDNGFDHSLRAAFPSVFRPAYAEAVSQRATLAPSISRSLAAFQNRTNATDVSPQPFTGLGASAPTHNPANAIQDSASAMSRGLEVRLWEMMLTEPRVSERKSGLPGIGLTQPKSRAFDAKKETNSHGAVLSNSEIYTCSNEEADLDEMLAYHWPLEATADQARDFDHEMLNGDQLEYAPTGHRSDDAATCSSSSFEELAGSHVLLNSSANEWTSFRDTNGASSQSSAINSEVCGSAEQFRLPEPSNRNEDYELCDKLIGQCEQLTQIPIRRDPPDGDMLTGHLSLECGELYLEDLHTSTIRLEHDTNSESHIVSDPEPIARTRLVNSTSYPLRDWIDTSVDVPACTELGDFFELNAFDPGLDPAAQEKLNDILFDTQNSDMQTTEDDTPGWSLDLPARAAVATHQHTGWLHRRNTSQPEPETVQQQFFSRPFVKRSSTISMLSSSTASPPKRHGSLLKRLSRSSSKASKHEELEMVDFDPEKVGGRSVELKRRKTLEDYDVEVDQDDDEMLFV